MRCNYKVWLLMVSYTVPFWKVYFHFVVGDFRRSLTVEESAQQWHAEDKKFPDTSGCAWESMDYNTP